MEIKQTGLGRVFFQHCNSIEVEPCESSVGELRAGLLISKINSKDSGLLSSKMKTKEYKLVLTSL